MSATFWNRVLSLGVAGLAVWLMYSRVEHPSAAGRLAGVMIIALICIWFGEQVGEFTGFFRGHHISTTTPGCLVVVVGWLLLVVASFIGLFVLDDL